ncbi:MAG: hypothetical protein A2513_01190 [Sulfurimonas sp. RIFOXYD12_FULL_33_39]|nr:MAG: hypothetical protein A2513_01190 [Sulfurimonas sp. RIFOXYD12_FULL_33_39]
MNQDIFNDRFLYCYLHQNSYLLYKIIVLVVGGSDYVNITAKLLFQERYRCDETTRLFSHLFTLVIISFFLFFKKMM